MNYKQRIILSKQNTNHLIMENEIVPVVHYKNMRTHDDVSQTYFFKVCVSDENSSSMEFVDNSASYVVQSLPLKGYEVYSGSRAWNLLYNDVYMLREEVDVQISLAYIPSAEGKLSEKDKICLDVLPMSFADIKVTSFCVDEIDNPSVQAPYGFKFSILKYLENTPNEISEETSELRFTYLTYGPDLYDKYFGFHEIVVQSYRRIQISQNIGCSIYMEPASIYDLLYSEIIRKFNSNTNNKLKRYSKEKIITRDWLISFFANHNKQKYVHVDLGGEGRFYESGCVSGFVNALNLNEKKINSQVTNIPEMLIPKLIFIDDWTTDIFPFGDNSIDLLTMQAIPIPLTNTDYENEYNEICRCMEKNGQIKIWCLNDKQARDPYTAINANKFFEVYEECRCTNGGVWLDELKACAENKGILDNCYYKFYCNLPLLCIDGQCQMFIPVDVKTELTTHLGMEESVILTYKFLYDQFDSIPKKDNPTGYVNFHSGGGYTVEFFLKYTNSDGKLVEIETGRMLLGNKKTYDLPAGASDYEVSCCAWNGSKWKDAFYTEKSETPFNCTFRTYGALPNPKMEKIED